MKRDNGTVLQLKVDRDDTKCRHAVFPIRQRPHMSLLHCHSGILLAGPLMTAKSINDERKEKKTK